MNRGKKLLDKLNYLVLNEGKELTSNEVLEVSHELDEFVLEKTKELNEERLNRTGQLV